MRVPLVLMLFVQHFIYAVAGAYSPSEFRVLDMVADDRVRDVLIGWSTTEQQRQDIVRSHAQYTSSVVELDRALTVQLQTAGEAELERLMDFPDPFGSKKILLATPPDQRHQLEDLSKQRQDDPLWARAHELHAAMHTIRTSGWQQSDALLHQWITGVSEILNLSEEQQQSVERMVRRMNLFPTVQDSTDFAVPLDIERLIEFARSLIEKEPSLSPEHKESLWFRFHQIQQDCEDQIDVLAAQMLAKQRSPRPTRLGGFSPDSIEGQRVLREWADDWRRKYSIFWRLVTQVGDTLATLASSRIKEAWQQFAYQQICPQLAMSRWPDRMVDWLIEHNGTSQQIDAAVQLHSAYKPVHLALVESAIEAGASLKARSYLPNFRAPGQLESQFAERMLDIHRHSRTCIRQFCGLLTSQQQQILAESDFGHNDPSLTGPLIPEPWLDAHGRKQYMAPVLK